MLPSKLRLIWLSGFRGEDLKKMANQKKELSLVAMFVNGKITWSPSFVVRHPLTFHILIFSFETT
jgi:hypothetical protein